MGVSRFGFGAVLFAVVGFHALHGSLAQAGSAAEDEKYRIFLNLRFLPEFRQYTEVSVLGRVYGYLGEQNLPQEEWREFLVFGGGPSGLLGSDLAARLLPGGLKEGDLYPDERFNDPQMFKLMHRSFLKCSTCFIELSEQGTRNGAYWHFGVVNDANGEIEAPSWTITFNLAVKNHRYVLNHISLDVPEETARRHWLEAFRTFAFCPPLAEDPNCNGPGGFTE